MGGAKEKIINSKSRAFLAFCFSFMLGVGCLSGLREQGSWPIFLFVIFCLLVFNLIVFWSYPVWRFIFLTGLFFITGMGRVVLATPAISDSKVLKNYNNLRAEMIVKITTEPQSTLNKTNYVLSAESITLPGIGNKKIVGNLYWSGPLYPIYNYGNRLRINCLLSSPRASPAGQFDAERYYSFLGIWTICRNGSVVEILDNKMSWSEKIVDWFWGKKIGLEKRINILWKEPEASLLSGILYGARSSLPPEVKSNFNKAGITHIIAVSGYNVSIVAIGLAAVLIFFGCNRRQAFWLSVIGIIIFVLFTGASSSAVRAGIMAIIILVAKQIGRLSEAGRALVFTATLMLLLNPLVLIWDAGFQLSFLATLGLVYLSPPLKNWLEYFTKKIFQKKFKVFISIFNSEVLISTLAAIFATLPLILFQFNRLSIVAPIANILVLWIIPWLMLFGMIAIVASYLFFSLGQGLAWVVGIGLKYVIISADKIGNLPGASLSGRLPLWGMIGCYLILFLIVIKFRKKSDLI